MILIKNTLLGLLFFGLLFLSGCMSVNHESEQTFREDGTSTLKVTEYVGINSEMLTDMGTLSKQTETSASSIIMTVMQDYYGKPYADYLCSLMSEEVGNCNPKSDGTVEIEVELEPGEFYKYEKETDWLNLKEIRTYKIEKVATANYYAIKDKGYGDYQETLKKDMAEYIEQELDGYLDKDGYCAENPPFKCEITDLEESKMDIKISITSKAKKIVWAACSNEYNTYFEFLNESKARSELENVVPLNAIVSENMPVTVSLICPSDIKSVVISYQSTTSERVNMDPTLVAFDIKTKEQLRQEVQVALDNPSSSNNFNMLTGTEPTDVNKYFLDFKKSQMFGSEFEKLGQLSGASAQLMQMNIDIEYSALFQNNVISAKIGNEEIYPHKNKIKLSLKELEDLPEGELVVITEKELSPVGAYTWVIIGIIVIAAGSLLLFRKKW